MYYKWEYINYSSIKNCFYFAVKRHHDQGNSYKEKYLIGAGLYFQRLSPLSSLQKSWQQGGRQYSGEGAESSTS